MNKINLLLVLLITSSSFVMGDLITTIQCPKTLDIEYSLRCTISIQNVGNKTLRNITTRCYLPTGFTYRERKTGKFSLKWLTPELKPGAVHNHKFSLKALSLGEFTITAQAKTTGNSHTAIHHVKIVSPNIGVKTITSSRYWWLNKPTMFITTIHNKGNASAHHVISEGTLPNQLEYISSEPQGVFTPATGERLAKIEWRFTEIAPGEKIQVKVTARATTGIPRALYTVITNFRDQELQTDTAITAWGGGAGLHVSTYDTDDPVEIGKQTVYVITVRNEGTSAATNVALKNIIPLEMEFVKAEGPTDYVYDKKAHELQFQNVAILQPGDKLTYKIVCKAIKQGSAKNTARVKYAEFDRPIIDEEGTSIYESKHKASH